MTKLGETAKYIRSKNAGPFWISMDIFFDTDEAYARAAAAPGLSAAAVAGIYGTAEERVKLFYLPQLKVIKISFPRSVPQGAPDERDMHAGQQYIPLLDLVLEP